MEVKPKFNISFAEGLKELGKRKLNKSLLEQIIKPIVEKSKRFIKSGKVRPALAKSTIEQRKKIGISQSKPLFKTGALANSLRADTQGIKSSARNNKGEYYAKFHYYGGDNGSPPERKFITAKSEGEYLTSEKSFPDKINKEFKSKFSKLLSNRIRKKKWKNQTES